MFDEIDVCEMSFNRYSGVISSAQESVALKIALGALSHPSKLILYGEASHFTSSCHHRFTGLFPCF